MREAAHGCGAWRVGISRACALSITLAVAMLAAATVTAQEQTPGQAPDFTVATEQGEEIRLSALRGKVVVLDFWGTWCPPCIEAVPELAALQRDYSGRSFALLSLSSDSNEPFWREFIRDKGMLAWPQVLDRGDRLQRLYGVRAFPTYIVVDGEGIIRYRAAGSKNNTRAALRRAVEKALKTAPQNRP